MKLSIFAVLVGLAVCSNAFSISGFISSVAKHQQENVQLVSDQAISNINQIAGNIKSNINAILTGNPFLVASTIANNCANMGKTVLNQQIKNSQKYIADAIEDLKQFPEITESTYINQPSPAIPESTISDQQSPDITESTAINQQSFAAIESTVDVQQSSDATVNTATNQQSLAVTEITVADQLQSATSDSTIADQQSTDVAKSTTTVQQPSDTTESTITNQQPPDGAESTVDVQQSPASSTNAENASLISDCKTEPEMSGTSEGMFDSSTTPQTDTMADGPLDQNENTASSDKLTVIGKSERPEVLSENETIFPSKEKIPPEKNQHRHSLNKYKKSKTSRRCQSFPVITAMKLSIFAVLVCLAVCSHAFSISGFISSVAKHQQENIQLVSDQAISNINQIAKNIKANINAILTGNPFLAASTIANNCANMGKTVLNQQIKNSQKYIADAIEDLKHNQQSPDVAKSTTTVQQPSDTTESTITNQQSPDGAESTDTNPKPSASTEGSPTDQQSPGATESTVDVQKSPATSTNAENSSLMSDCKSEPEMSGTSEGMFDSSTTPQTDTTADGPLDQNENTASSDKLTVIGKSESSEVLSENETIFPSKEKLPYEKSEISTIGHENQIENAGDFEKTHISPANYGTINEFEKLTIPSASGSIISHKEAYENMLPLPLMAKQDSSISSLLKKWLLYRRPLQFLFFFPYIHAPINA
ncbi:unnamed protein product [Nezara viridula]|uniref:Neuropeptide n=1 Tax=Nezara viridula TaxID=85310 RepID=A0A9P0H8M8_NEZVI|nr:unnamed protein product [Nezara viridula]